MVLDFFWKTSINKEIPKDMKREINKLKNCNSKQNCLIKAYELLKKKYTGYMLLTYPLIHKVFFYNNPNKLWSEKNFMHCTNLNYLLRILLVYSGWFSDDDLKLKWCLHNNISPHQYVKVRINKKKFIDVDLWAANHKVPLGKHA